jgi:hypothetical protein
MESPSEHGIAANGTASATAAANTDQRLEHSASDELVKAL